MTSREQDTYTGVFTVDSSKVIDRIITPEDFVEVEGDLIEELKQSEQELEQQEINLDDSIDDFLGDESEDASTQAQAALLALSTLDLIASETLESIAEYRELWKKQGYFLNLEIDMAHLTTLPEITPFLPNARRLAHTICSSVESVDQFVEMYARTIEEGVKHIRRAAEQRIKDEWEQFSHMFDDDIRALSEFDLDEPMRDVTSHLTRLKQLYDERFGDTAPTAEDAKHFTEELSLMIAADTELYEAYPQESAATELRNVRYVVLTDTPDASGEVMCDMLKPNVTLHGDFMHLVGVATYPPATMSPEQWKVEQLVAHGPAIAIKNAYSKDANKNICDIYDGKIIVVAFDHPDLKIIVSDAHV